MRPGRYKPQNINGNNKQNFDFAAEQAALLDLEALDEDESGWLPTDTDFDWDTTQAVLSSPDDEKTLDEVAEQTTYGAIFLNELIKRQRALSLSVAFVFLVFIFSFPLISFLGPELVNIQIFGLPVTWLLLGVLVYPLVWFLAFFFVSTSDKYEEEFTQLVNGGQKPSKNLFTPRDTEEYTEISD